MPHSNSLIVRAAGNEFTTRADSRHSHPFPVSRKCFHTVARCHFPDLDGLIPGGAYYEITLRHKRNRVDIVIVTVHGLDASERLMEIPQLDGHVCTAGGEQLARGVECDILHAVSVALQRSLEVAAFKVPYLEG